MRNSLATLGLDSRSGMRLDIVKHTARRISKPPKSLSDPAPYLAEYVEQKFIPNHVAFKTYTGRRHYRAILKHVLMPETVEGIFSPYDGASRARLRAVPDWPYLDDIRLCDLKADHVKQLTSSAMSRGYSPQTIKHIKNVLGKVITHARKEGLFSGENPASEIKLPPILHKTVHSLTIAEAKTILKAMKFPEREIALITMTTGMALSEICVLRWKDINFTERAVYSDGEVIPPHHALVKRHSDDVDGFSSAIPRIRTVEIPGPLARRLQRLRRAIQPSEPEAFLLKRLGEIPFHQGQFGSRLELICKEVGMPWLSWQALKRAHLSLLYDLRAQLTDELASRLR